MSGVANEETTPPAKTADTAAAGAPAATAPAADAMNAEAENRARRPAPRLRVVTDDDVPPPPVETVDEIRPAQRIGAFIRSARENQGLTLEQVSKETRITVSHLRAIEEMTPNLIGVPVYVQGHVRTYARHLRLDADAILTRYKSECALLSDPEKPQIAPPVVGSKKLPVSVPVLGVMLVALAGAAAVAMFGGETNDAASAAADSANPAATAAAAPAAVSPPLRLVALQRARIEVRSAAGDKFLDREFAPGESYNPRVGAGWTVTVQDGAAFEWRIGDQSLGLFADEGGPVYAQSVDAAAQRPPIVVAAPEPVLVSPAESVIAPGDPAFAGTSAGTPAANPVRTGPAPTRPRATAPAAASAPATEPAPPTTVEIAPPTPQNDPSLQAYPDN